MPFHSESKPYWLFGNTQNPTISPRFHYPGTAHARAGPQRPWHYQSLWCFREPKSGFQYLYRWFVRGRETFDVAQVGSQRLEKRWKFTRHIAERWISEIAESHFNAQNRAEKWTNWRASHTVVPKSGKSGLSVVQSEPSVIPRPGLHFRVFNRHKQVHSIKVPVHVRKDRSKPRHQCPLNLLEVARWAAPDRPPWSEPTFLAVYITGLEERYLKVAQKQEEKSFQPRCKGPRKKRTELQGKNSRSNVLRPYRAITENPSKHHVLIQVQYFGTENLYKLLCWCKISVRRQETYVCEWGEKVGNSLYTEEIKQIWPENGTILGFPIHHLTVKTRAILFTVYSPK